MGTYELQRLLEAENDVYLNPLRATSSADSAKAQQKITDGLVRIMDFRHDAAHPPAARLEMRALGPPIRTLATFRGDALAVHELGDHELDDMGLAMINILSSKLLPR